MSNNAEKRLPKLVDMVGDRIGLDYNLPRREVTESYVKQHERLDILNLKYSSYSLTEQRTKKHQEDVKTTRNIVQRNPLKLNSKMRKLLFRLTPSDKLKISYKLMMQVHNLWLQESQKILSINNDDPNNIYKLVLHGCLLKCAASKNPTLVEIEGIVLQETRNTFLVVTISDRIVTLPKRESIFEFRVNSKLYRIHGCNLLTTIQARSKAKYKQKRSVSDV